jgi:hypothetical protein
MMHPEHLADLRKSGLTDEIIKAAGVYTVPPDEIDTKLGGLANGVVSALAFPISRLTILSDIKSGERKAPTPRLPSIYKRPALRTTFTLPLRLTCKGTVSLP